MQAVAKPLKEIFLGGNLVAVRQKIEQIHVL
jgi:hypothetical protein